MTIAEDNRSAQRQQQRMSLSGSDMAAQLVADIITAKVEAKKQAEAEVVEAVTKRRRRGRAWYFLFALPLLIVVTVWNLVKAANPPDVFTPDERESSIRFRIYLAAQAVEAYRDSVGRWPANLATVGFGDAGLAYQASGRDFEIADTAGSAPLSYRRGDMLRPFANSYYQLKRGPRKPL